MLTLLGRTTLVRPILDGANAPCSMLNLLGQTSLYGPLRIALNLFRRDNTCTANYRERECSLQHANPFISDVAVWGLVNNADNYLLRANPFKLGHAFCAHRSRMVHLQQRHAPTSPVGTSFAYSGFPNAMRSILADFSSQKA